jgi:DNA polymerase-1
MKTLVFDAEADGLIHNFNKKWEYFNVSKVWCIAAKDPDTGDEYTFGPDSIDKAFKHFNHYNCLIGHNIINYDLRMFELLYGYRWFGGVIDTLVLSKYLHPERAGGHSIEAWAKRLGMHKPEHEDWSQFSPEMLHRCQEDTRINVMVWDVLQEELRQRNQFIEPVRLYHSRRSAECAT